MTLLRFKAKEYMYPAIGDKRGEEQKMRYYNITVDFDGYMWNENRLRQKLETIAFLYPRESFIRESSSGAGFHVRICLDKPIHVNELLQLRDMLSDDPVRVYLDRLRVQNDSSESINVLFDQKRGKKSGEWMELSAFLAEVDCLDLEGGKRWL